MCQSSLPERTHPAPRKPSNRSAIDVPACTHACMSRSSSAATRRVIETVSGPSSAPAVVTSVVVPVLVLMLEGSSGAGSRAGLPDPGRDDAGRPEGATGIRRRDARVLRYAWCGDTREVRTSLADAEAREGRRLGAALLEHLADGLLGVLGERLLEQDVLLEEAVDATLDDAGKGSLGLALLLGRGLGDATLVLDRLGRDLLARQHRGAERGGVHRDVATDGLVATLERDEDTDLRGQVGARLVEVGHDLVALEARHAADLDLLADGGVGLVEQLLDGLAVLERAGEERVGVGGAGGDGLREDLVGQGDELLALRDEVGLAVDLDQGADAVGGRGRHEAVGGRAALTLRDALEALDAKDLDGLGAVAVGLVERLLDVHHAGARLLAQRLDVSGGVVRHALYRSFRQWRLTRVSAGSGWCGRPRPSGLLGTGRRVSGRSLSGGIDRDLGGDLGGRRLDGGRDRRLGSSLGGVDLGGTSRSLGR